mgnify:CR=1 FL=1
MTHTTFQNPEVSQVFDQYSGDIQQQLMALRELIFQVAAENDEIGELEETLKWGQPGYLTPQTRSGTTVRIDKVRNQPTQYAMYVSCQTTLVDSFRQRFPDFTYEGDRAIIFDVMDTVPQDDIKECIHMALTYHLRKRQMS